MQTANGKEGRSEDLSLWESNVQISRTSPFFPDVPLFSEVGIDCQVVGCCSAENEEMEDLVEAEDL